MAPRFFDTSPMNEEQRRKIDLLNIRYFTEFGVTPDGRLRFKWMRTDEMPMEFGRGYDTHQDKESGLWLASREYKRRTAAETTGHGLCWTIAYLEPPVSRETWIAEHGTDVPWPAQGYYRPIDNITRHIELLPDEDSSAQAAYNIRHHLDLDLKDFVEIEEAATAKRNAAFKQEVSDMVDDATPAFGNNPGGKGSVSFPATQ